MRKLVFALAMLAAQHNAHCPFLLGVQMPPDGKLTVYFVPPFTTKPACVVDFGEAQLYVTAGFVRITGKADTRVDLRCTEVNQ